MIHLLLVFEARTIEFTTHLHYTISGVNTKLELASDDVVCYYEAQPVQTLQNSSTNRQPICLPLN